MARGNIINRPGPSTYFLITLYINHCKWLIQWNSLCLFWLLHLKQQNFYQNAKNTWITTKAQKLWLWLSYKPDRWIEWMIWKLHSSLNAVIRIYFYTDIGIVHSVLCFLLARKSCTDKHLSVRDLFLTDFGLPTLTLKLSSDFLVWFKWR